MWAQFSASFLASSHGSSKCGTHFTNIDPTAVTLQAASGAMFPSGVHRQYLQNIQFGNQPIFYFFIFFLTFSKSLTCIFQINLKGLFRPPPVSCCVGPPFAASVLVKLQCMWENDNFMLYYLKLDISYISRNALINCQFVPRSINFTTVHQQGATEVSGKLPLSIAWQITYWFANY